MRTDKSKILVGQDVMRNGVIVVANCHFRTWNILDENLSPLPEVFSASGGSSLDFGLP